MKVLGIGNAIVDVLCKVNDQFILDHNLSKGTMRLVDEKEFKKLLTNLKIEDTVSGGSVANSIVGMSQLGDEVSFIGKVNDDELGQKYIEGLRKENVKYFYQTKKGKVPTGTCLILITPDSERTMCTFLGIAGQIDDNDIDTKAIQNAEITFLEGYLWDEGGPTKAFEKALSAAKKSAMSLSDPFCVDRHKDSFLNLVENKLDIIFANEKEAISLIDAKNFDEVIEFGKSLNKLFIITRSDKGSIAIEGNDISEAQAKSNLKIVDLTGAGDLFAAGFLHGLTNNKNPYESLNLGTEMASKIIQKIGARLD